MYSSKTFNGDSGPLMIGYFYILVSESTESGKSFYTRRRPAFKSIRVDFSVDPGLCRVFDNIIFSRALL